MGEAVAVRQRDDAAERVAALGEVRDEPERDADHAALALARVEARGDRDALVDAPRPSRGRRPAGAVPSRAGTARSRARGRGRRRAPRRRAAARGGRRRAAPRGRACGARPVRPRPGRRRRGRCAGAARGRPSASACSWRRCAASRARSPARSRSSRIPGTSSAAAASSAIASAAAPPAIQRHGTGGTAAPRGGVHTPNQAPRISRRPSRRSSTRWTVALSGRPASSRVTSSPSRSSSSPCPTASSSPAQNSTSVRPSWQSSSVSRRPASPESRRAMIASMRAQALSYVGAVAVSLIVAVSLRRGRDGPARCRRACAASARARWPRRPRS